MYVNQYFCNDVFSLRIHCFLIKYTSTLKGKVGILGISTLLTREVIHYRQIQRLTTADCIIFSIGPG